MPMRVAETALNAACNGAVDLLNTGGFVRFYTGTPPATLAGAPAGTLLAEVDLAVPAFGAAAAGAAAALGVPIATTGLADGTIGWFRVLAIGGTNADTLWDDDSVGTVPGATSLVVNTLTVSTGVDFTLTAYTFSASPEST